MILNNVRYEAFLKTCDFLNAKKCPFFLGGSRFFGFETSLSDYDVFTVYKSEIIRELKDEGFIVDSKSHGYPDGEVLNFKDLIHVVFVTDKMWIKLQEEHIRVKSRVDQNVDILKICKYLKKKKLLKGNEIYQMLKDF